MVDALNEAIATLRGLGEIPTRAAAIAAPLLEAAAKKQAASGIDPSGRPWAPRKKDGGRALANAAEAVRAEVTGDVVEIVVDGPEYFHQTAKEGGAMPRRQIIPDVGDPLPPTYQAALDEAADEAFNATGGT